MVAANGYDAYTNVSVQTADRGKLVLMCYDGAVKFLVQGKEKLLNEEYEEKTNLLNRAQDIVSELLNALNFEAGGQIATNLASLYGYMLSRVLYADIHRDVAAIDEVIGMLKKLREGWEQVFSSQPAEPQNRTVVAQQHASITTSA